MASEILIRIRSIGKERSHEKPLLNKVRISVPQPDDKADTSKRQTGIKAPFPSLNLDGLEVGNYLLIHINSDCFLFE